MPVFPFSLHSKLPRVGTSIFTVMSRMANEYGAINLSQGFPDFRCSAELVELVNKAMKEGHNQYAPMAGLPKLREEIAKKTVELYNASYNPETEITITAGATQAIYTAIAAVVNEGDEVIVFTPAYDCYEPAIEMQGGKPVFIQLQLPNYHIDWNTVRKMINQKTRMIIINTPHNPTGSILKENDIAELEKILAHNHIILLSDEVYEHIIFDNQPHLSMARYPKLAEKSFIISSFGKTYHTTGWKIGYCIAPEILMNEFRKIHQYIVFSANTAIQYAYSEILKHKELYLQLPMFYQKKRDTFLNLIQHSRFIPLHTEGSYFQLLNYTNISKENDVAFAEKLIKEHKIASIPVSVFYNQKTDNHMLRFCFAKEDETLEKAAEILKRI
ncbi:MAG: methionine aminotransferase [Flavobacteriales bacterium]|nr:methionine aminotransferase [Flavobacteriales bacterium]